MISDKLLERTFSYFDKHYNDDYVVKPSLPILYFGDLVAYEKSPLRVVTVGKNPSDNEFRNSKSDNFSFLRFKNWNPNQKNLQETLNRYFFDAPLRQWFSSFEPILNGMNCSYYENQINRAIHTDICSPLVTFPTWSNLGENKERLFNEGFLIWKDLIEEIQPDIMLISVPRELYNKTTDGVDEDLISFNTKKDGSYRLPYKVSTNFYKLRNGKIVKLIYGQAAQKPFDKISKEQKKIIGEKCLK